MTVQELIDHLRQLPPDRQVLVEGYDNGWDSLCRAESGHVKQQVPAEDWDGEFERLDLEGLDSSQVVLLMGVEGIAAEPIGPIGRIGGLPRRRRSRSPSRRRLPRGFPTTSRQSSVGASAQPMAL